MIVITNHPITSRHSCYYAFIPPSKTSDETSIAKEHLPNAKFTISFSGTMLLYPLLGKTTDTSMSMSKQNLPHANFIS